jgi:hypothetical protein
MSDTDSIMAEVTDELRRDRLFALFRRWAWLAILLVVFVVGGAAWNEWRKSRETTAARAVGDAVIAALAAPDAAARAQALAGIEADGDAAAFVAMLAAAEAIAAEDADAEISNDRAAERAETARWQDAARLKAILAQSGETTPGERIAELEPLTASGAPFRLLALEQTAYAYVEQGETDAAVALLRDVIADGGVTDGLRRRASEMIVALGGTIEPGAGG